MVRHPVASAAFLALAAFALAGACSTEPPAPVATTDSAAACSASNCDGCCTVAGSCKTEQSASFCGLKGSTCSVCSGGTACVAGACTVVDSGPPPCTQNGTDACNAYLTAYCTRAVTCCNAGGSCDPKCNGADGNACDLTSCKALELTLTKKGGGLGVDCSAAKYTSKTVCAEVTKKCTDQVPLISCSDILNGTPTTPPPIPADCKSFL